MINCNFYLDTGEPTDGTYLGFSVMHAIPGLGHLIDPCDQMAKWTAVYGKHEPPIARWRVTAVTWFLGGGVAVSVIPCLNWKGKEIIDE